MTRPPTEAPLSYFGLQQSLHSTLTVPLLGHTQNWQSVDWLDLSGARAKGSIGGVAGQSHPSFGQLVHGSTVHAGWPAPPHDRFT